MSPYLIIIPILLTFIGILHCIQRIQSLEAKVKHLESTLDMISDPDSRPEPAVNDELRTLIQQGNTVAAVKRVRETMWLSLLNAKQYVDRLSSSEQIK